MFHEEQPHLKLLPSEGFRYFKQVTRTYYAALPAAPHAVVTVRVYDREIQVLDLHGEVLRRHEKALRKGSFTIEEGDRLFNPSRETARLLEKAARIGPRTEEMGRLLFATLGRPGHRALYGLTHLARTYRREDIEAVSARFLEARCYSFRSIRDALKRRAAASAAPEPALTQTGPVVRAIAEYQAFWEAHAQALEP